MDIILVIAHYISQSPTLTLSVNTAPAKSFQLKLRQLVLTRIKLCFRISKNGRIFSQYIWHRKGQGELFFLLQDWSLYPWGTMFKNSQQVRYNIFFQIRINLTTFSLGQHSLRLFCCKICTSTLRIPPRPQTAPTWPMSLTRKCR